MERRQTMPIGSDITDTIKHNEAANDGFYKLVKEFTNPEINKKAWGPGPWQDEPDKIHWIDPATDLDVLMVRNERNGHWCGYVGVTEGHPAFGMDYDDVPDISVHGGLTYADECLETDDPAKGVCHVPFPGRPDHVWWLGFDCAHAWDLSPGRNSTLRKYGMTTYELEDKEVYRTRAYVESEIRDLAGQLKALADGPRS
jgi:hypothetical protein